MKLTSKTVKTAAAVALATVTLASQASAKPAAGTKPLPKKIIKKFDTNKNGSLEGEEVKALLAAVEANKKEIETIMLKRFDADKNGTLDKKEKRAAKKKLREEAKEIKAATLKKFDADGDGKLKGKERKGIKEWLKTTYPDMVPKELVPAKFKLPTA